MLVTVLGANGNVGQEVVAQALAAGHRVRAFVHTRDPFADHPSLEVSAGDTGDAAAVGDAVSGADSIVGCLGSFGRRSGNVLGPAVSAVAQALCETPQRRIVTLTGAADVMAGGGLQLRSRVNRAVLTAMDRPAVRDSESHLARLRASRLSWTTVCAPAIKVDGPPGFYVSEAMPSLLASVSRAAVAAALLELAASSDFVGQAVGIHSRRSEAGRHSSGVPSGGSDVG